MLEVALESEIIEKTPGKKPGKNQKNTLIYKENRWLFLFFFLEFFSKKKRQTYRPSIAELRGHCNAEAPRSGALSHSREWFCLLQGSENVSDYLEVLRCFLVLFGWFT